MAVTLRELLDAASPGTWIAFEDEYGYHVENGLHEYTLGRGESVYADTRLFALAPELAALVLDMADALRADEETMSAVDWLAWHKTREALLARLDRISTQTQGEATTSLSQEASALTSTVASGGGIGVASRAVSPCACVCDPPDQVFSRTLCACGAMHTYCAKCGEQLDDCDTHPCCEDAGDCGEDCGTA